MTNEEFAEHINCPVADVRRLIARKMIVTGPDGIDARIDWLAISKLVAEGWRTVDGRTVPIGKRRKPKRVSKREAALVERYARAR